jgi:hypothetical protein
MFSLSGEKARTVPECVGDPPVSMAVASMAFPVQRSPRTPIRILKPKSCAKCQLLFAGGSAAADDFCAPHGIAVAKHFE